MDVFGKPPRSPKIYEDRSLLVWASKSRLVCLFSPVCSIFESLNPKPYKP